MSKKFFEQWLAPRIAEIQSHPHLQFFGKLLADPNLWHLNRHSLSGGMAVGLFAAFIPLPAQMFIAASLAIFFRVNLPLAVSLVWITNPITMLPVFYTAYNMGAVILGSPPLPPNFSLSSDWVLTTLSDIWQPFLLGSLVLSILSAFIGYFIVQVLWRLQVNRLWRQRRAQRAAAQRAKSKNNP